MVQGRDTVKVRLTHKFAESINGIDLSRVRQGEALELSQRDASLLVAEGWAELLDRAKLIRRNGRADAADKPATRAGSQGKRSRQLSIRRLPSTDALRRRIVCVLGESHRAHMAAAG